MVAMGFARAWRICTEEVRFAALIETLATRLTAEAADIERHRSPPKQMTQLALLDHSPGVKEVPRYYELWVHSLGLLYCGNDS